MWAPIHHAFYCRFIEFFLFYSIFDSIEFQSIKPSIETVKTPRISLNVNENGKSIYRHCRAPFRDEKKETESLCLTKPMHRRTRPNYKRRTGMLTQFVADSLPAHAYSMHKVLIILSSPSICHAAHVVYGKQSVCYFTLEILVGEKLTLNELSLSSSSSTFRASIVRRIRSHTPKFTQTNKTNSTLGDNYSYQI